MNNVTVINMRWQKAHDYRCDRQSPVGNPYYMRDKSLQERDLVCDKYEDYFNRCVSDPLNAPKGFIDYLTKMVKASQERSITLGCWCAPSRCHCDTIKAYIERVR